MNLLEIIRLILFPLFKIVKSDFLTEEKEEMSELERFKKEREGMIYGMKIIFTILTLSAVLYF